jgi:hypothetical protein
MPLTAFLSFFRRTLAVPAEQKGVGKRGSIIKHSQRARNSSWSRKMATKLSGPNVCSNLSQYNDPKYAMLGDLLNARAKIRFGALSHIITARILASHSSVDELEKLMEDPKQLDELFSHVASEVLPKAPSAAPDDSFKNQSATLSSFGTLARNNSWSDLLQFDRS